MNFGLNLFSISNLISTEEDFLKTAIKLREMGYSHMQFSGAGYDVDKIKRVSEASQMPICLTHVPYDRIVNETQALMEEHAKFDCKYIGLGMMPWETILDEIEFKKTVEILNKVGEKMEENGFKFLYHHHHFEFIKYGGKTCFDYMVENAPHINFTADTYWLQYGGVEVTSMLEKLNGRIPCVHLKDYKIELNQEKRLAPTITYIGDGVMDFKKIIEKMSTLGVEYYLVEQDNAAHMPDPLSQVENSILYLKELDIRNATTIES